MRNSSLVEQFCAENVWGLKHITEAADALDFQCVVGERSVSLRRHTVRSAGGIGSENAGISNDKTGEKPVRRKPKDSRVKLICSGLVGP